MRSDAEEALLELPAGQPAAPGGAHHARGRPRASGDAEQGDLILALAADEATRLGAADARVMALSERSLVAAARGDYPAGGCARIRGPRPGAGTVTWRTIRRAPSSSRCARGPACARAGGTRPAPTSTKAHLLSQSLADALPWFAVQARLELARAHVTLRDADAASGAPDGGRRDPRPPAQRSASSPSRPRRSRGQIDTMPTASGHGSGLTTAELRVLPLLQTHLSFREIGERQFVSRNTIKTQAISIYRKLGVSSRSGAIERAAELGLIDAEAHAASAEFIRSG